MATHRTHDEEEGTVPALRERASYTKWIMAVVAAILTALFAAAVPWRLTSLERADEKLESEDRHMQQEIDELKAGREENKRLLTEIRVNVDWIKQVLGGGSSVGAKHD